MAKKTLRIAATLGALALALTGCVAADDDEQSDTTADGDGLENMAPITLTVTVNEPEGSTNVYLREYLGQVEEKTDGKVAFEYFYGGSLLAGDQVLQGVADGVADIGTVTPAFFPDELPTVNWFQQLGSLSSAAWPLGTLAESAAVYTYFQDSEQLQADYEASGVVSIYNTTTPKGDMICNQPAETLADVDGLRVRVAGQNMAGEAEAIGMAPTFLTVAEIYEALERGVLDCAAIAGGSSTVFGPFGWIDVAPYFAPSTLASTPGIGLVMNKDVYDSLPDEVKQIFRESAVVAVAQQMESFLAGRAAFVDTLLAAQNGTFHDASEINEQLSRYQESVRAAMVDNAPAGADAQAIIDGFSARLSEWEAKLADAGLPTTGGLDADGFQQAPDLVDWDAFSDLLVAAVQ